MIVILIKCIKGNGDELRIISQKHLNIKTGISLDYLWSIVQEPTELITMSFLRLMQPQYCSVTDFMEILIKGRELCVA